MFDTLETWTETVDDRQVEAWEEQLRRIEADIATLRAHQTQLIARLDRHQPDTAAGMATMGNWVSAHLDVSSQTGDRLWQVARAADPLIDNLMATGRCGLDRAAALVKLKAAGITDRQFTQVVDGYSLGRLYGLLDRLRTVTTDDEQTGFAHRYLVIQPSLDDAVYKLWGALPGIDGRVVEQALHRRETQLPVLPGQGQGQRRADALASICLDALTGVDDTGTHNRAVTVAEVFVDADIAADSAGEAGATLSTGLRVGPETLAEILCEGLARVIITDGMHPVAYTDRTGTIPRVIRNQILRRDMGQCSIEGCTSRYRLQIHHMCPRSRGGNHHSANLVTACWYHHHVAIHQLGYTVDPSSPIHRRRLLPPRANGPPLRHVIATIRPATTVAAV